MIQTLKTFTEVNDAESELKTINHSEKVKIPEAALFYVNSELQPL